MGKAMLLAAVLATIPVNAMAQGPSRLTRHAERTDAGDVTRIWAECAADIERNWSRAMLETLPTTAAEQEAFDRHIGENDRCLTNNELLMYGKELRIPPEVARGEIARHLVRIELRKDARIPEKGAGTAWLRDRLAALPQGASYDRSVLIGHQFALCLADEHWAEASSLVVSQHGSKEEGAAFAALTPKFSGCMAAGANLKLTKPIVRLLLSEAAYHALTHQPKGMAR